MTNDTQAKKSSEDQNKDAAVKPDPETLHTTDPQEKMEGPISSLVQKATHSGGHETKAEADEKKEKKM